MGYVINRKPYPNKVNRITEITSSKVSKEGRLPTDYKVAYLSGVKQLPLNPTKVENR